MKSQFSSTLVPELIAKKRMAQMELWTGEESKVEVQRREQQLWELKRVQRHKRFDEARATALESNPDYKINKGILLQRYPAIKIMLFESMLCAPPNMKRDWLVYGLPNGLKCTVYTTGAGTQIRGKTGTILLTLETLLPGGGRGAPSTKRTILQGIYDVHAQIVYITDLVMWNSELFVEQPAESRIISLSDYLTEMPELSLELSERNQIRFRLPKLFDCTMSGLFKAYYGNYSQIGFSDLEIEPILNKLKNTLDPRFSPAMLSNPEKYVQYFCCACGSDHLNHPYVKNGLAFIHRDGYYQYGYSEECRKWKDINCSPHFDKSEAHSCTAKLFCSLDGSFQTYDEYTIPVPGPPLLAGKIYEFSYFSASPGESRTILLTNLLFHMESTAAVPHTASKLINKSWRIHYPLTFEILSEQISHQELPVIHQN